MSKLELVVAVESHHKRNLGPLIRTATVFGISILLVIGPTRYGTHGAHGSNLRLQIVHFYNWNEARTFLTMRCPNGLYYGICESAFESSLTDSTDGIKCSIKLEDCPFTPLDIAFPVIQNTSNSSSVAGMVTFVVGQHKGQLSDEALQFLERAVHVEFPVPGINDRLRFENMFSIVMDYYVTKVVNTSRTMSTSSTGASSSNGQGLTIVEHSGEKFTVMETLKYDDIDTVFAEQVAAAKEGRKTGKITEARSLRHIQEDGCLNGLFACSDGGDY
jgi:hypothetical protein